MHIYRVLHIPLQILNRANGSYRFVVCGLRGSEAVAFGELVNVFDKFTWVTLLIFICLLALVWKRLVSLSPNISSVNTLGNKLVSFVRILLEQGHVTDDCRATSSTKIRVFLGVTLLMSIVLSNGYKSANVYNMILPRQKLRYEYFSDLVADNVSIYTLSKHKSIGWQALEEKNLLSQNLSLTRISNHEISCFFNTTASLQHLITLETVLGDIRSPQTKRL